MGSLQRAGVRDLPGRNARQSRAGDEPRGQDAGHRRAVGSSRRGVHGAPGPDPRGGDARRPPACGGARSADLGHRRAGRAAVALHRLHLPGSGRPLARQCRTRRGRAPTMPSSWSRRVRSAARAFRYWRGTWHTKGAPRRFWSSSSRPGRRCPASTGPAASGSWNSMFGFVEALYLCGLHEEAAALSPLVEGVLALGRRWITFDGRLVETRAGLAAAAARRWEEAERLLHHRSRGRREDVQPRSSWPT